jgi:hypothetical protein
MRQRYVAGCLDVIWDAPHEKPVTVPNHFGAPAELNSRSTRTMNSKRYEPFRSTAIERNSLSRSECGPEEGECLRVEANELISPDR